MYVHTCVCVFVCVCIHTHTYVCVCVCVCVCVYTYTNVCVCVYTLSLSLSLSLSHTHTHTHRCNTLLEQTSNWAGARFQKYNIYIYIVNILQHSRLRTSSSIPLGQSRPRAPPLEPSHIPPLICLSLTFTNKKCSPCHSLPPASTHTIYGGRGISTGAGCGRAGGAPHVLLIICIAL